MAKSWLKNCIEIPPSLTDNSFKQFTDNPVVNSCYCRPVDKTELLKLIGNLIKNKSPGHDGITPRIIKETAIEISNPLLHIFNLSISLGRVPDQLKIAKVIPVFKKGDPQLPGNYRPISLLSVFDKILEKIMYNRLYSHLQNNNILYKYQFGFRKNYSTSLALIEVIDNIYKNMDEGNFCTGVFFDLQKAFDTVDHSILLFKMYNYGVRGVVYDWFKSYLSNRVQYTCIGSNKSDVVGITCGVPQGSVLGPLLFLIYMNDIGNAVPNDDVKLFADDTNLFVFGKSASETIVRAASCIDLLSNWFLSNKLSINLSKTCYMTFPSNLHCENGLSVNGVSIEKVATFKYLGVLLDDELNWCPHIDQIYYKLVKFTSIFYKLRDKLPKFILKNIYFAFIHPHIMYAVEIYANTCKTYLNKLTKLNNKLLRILQNKPFATPTSELYLNYSTLPVTDLHLQQLLIFVHKFIHHPTDIPHVFFQASYFVINNTFHEYNTRTNRNLHIFRPLTTHGQRNIKFKAAKLWNELPISLQDLTSICSFKKTLKPHLMSLRN